MQLPAEFVRSAIEPPAISAPPGIGAAAAQLPAAPVSIPIVVAPAAGREDGGAAPPAAPATILAEPKIVREPLPATAGSNPEALDGSYRIGYSEYLRNAGLSQVAALAGSGVTGILVLTGAGGLVGYRQAKAGHAIRTGGTARFVN